MEKGSRPTTNPQVSSPLPKQATKQRRITCSRRGSQLKRAEPGRRDGVYVTSCGPPHADRSVLFYRTCHEDAVQDQYVTHSYALTHQDHLIVSIWQRDSLQRLVGAITLTNDDY